MAHSGDENVTDRDTIIQSILDDLKTINGLAPFDADINLMRKPTDWTQQIFHGTVFRKWTHFPCAQVMDGRADKESLCKDLTRVIFSLAIFFAVSHDVIVAVDQRRNKLEKAIAYVLDINKQRNGHAYDSEVTDITYGAEPIFGPKVAGGIMRLEIIYFEEPAP